MIMYNEVMGLYTLWGPWAPVYESLQLVNITPTSLWSMVLIAIVTGYL